MCSCNFYDSLRFLTTPTINNLNNKLRKITKISDNECFVIKTAASEILLDSLYDHLMRLLLVELHSARSKNLLSGDTSALRWENFIALSSSEAFWDGLDEHYPTVNKRIKAIIDNRCEAVLSFTQHWAENKVKLKTLLGADAGALLELSFGAGDSHGGGKTVAFVFCEGGKVIYKPRPLAIDLALANFIAKLSQESPCHLSLYVPRVLTCEDHGWAEFIEHKYAANDAELREFYRGIGQWLSVLRLLGGTDMHGQNLIAYGACPVIIDCETLFTPKIPLNPSGYGAAMDSACEWVNNSVLGIGILPQRGTQLGWRGIDISASGSLSDQQPMMRVPHIFKEGTDEAYLGSISVPIPIAQNHPSAEPALRRYWPEVLSAFDTINHTLRRLDSEDTLRKWLEVFVDCQVRVVPRATEAYAELARMLWHPVSLHHEEDATQRSYKLLSSMADTVSLASDDPVVIAAEIEDLKKWRRPFLHDTCPSWVADRSC